MATLYELTDEYLAALEAIDAAGRRQMMLAVAGLTVAFTCRALGWACQLAGFTGLVILILVAFRHWVLWMEGRTP